MNSTRLSYALSLVALCACVDLAGGDTAGPTIGGGFTIAALAIAPDDLNYADVSGTVALDSSLSAGPTTATVRFYSDDYATIIASTTAEIGGALETIDDSQGFDITDYEVFVLPAYGGFAKVCAEFRADESNVSDYQRVGCIE